MKFRLLLSFFLLVAFMFGLIWVGFRLSLFTIKRKPPDG